MDSADKYKSLEGGSSRPPMSAIQAQVAQVKSIMMDSIDKVVQRGDKLELLQDRSDQLVMESDRFRSTGRALRSKMCWELWKMRLVMGLVVCLLLLVVILMACFTGGQNRCGGGK